VWWGVWGYTAVSGNCHFMLPARLYLYVNNQAMEKRMKKLFWIASARKDLIAMPDDETLSVLHCIKPRRVKNTNRRSR
jgi:hypothetical protein